MEAGYLMDGSDFCEGYAGVRWAVGPAGSTASTAGRLESAYQRRRDDLEGDFFGVRTGTFGTPSRAWGDRDGFEGDSLDGVV